MRTVPFRSPFRPRSLQRGRTGRREGQPGGVLLGATGSNSMCSVLLRSRIWDTASGQCLKTLIGECCWCPLQATGLCPRRGCLARLPPSLRSTASAPSARAPLPAAPSWCPVHLPLKDVGPSDSARGRQSPGLLSVHSFSRVRSPHPGVHRVGAEEPGGRAVRRLPAALGWVAPWGQGGEGGSGQGRSGAGSRPSGSGVRRALQGLGVAVGGAASSR